MTVILLLLLSALMKDVSADEHKSTSQQTPHTMLVSAMEKSQKQLSEFTKSHYLSFTREKVDRDGDIESYRYVAFGQNTGSWQKVDTEYSSNQHDSKVWESNILFSPESFEVNKAKLIEESVEFLVFDMPMQLRITVDSDDIEEHNHDVNVFRAKLQFNKTSHLIHSFEVYSVKEFSPQFGVDVDSYQSLNILLPLANQGPLVVVEQLESVRGDVGFFVSIDEDTEIKNFDFSVEKVQPAS
jgi:hypothetical protein